MTTKEDLWKEYQQRVKDRCVHTHPSGVVSLAEYTFTEYIFEQLATLHNKCSLLQSQEGVEE